MGIFMDDKIRILTVFLLNIILWAFIRVTAVSNPYVLNSVGET